MKKQYILILMTVAIAVGIITLVVSVKSSRKAARKEMPVASTQPTVPEKPERKKRLKINEDRRIVFDYQTYRELKYVQWEISRLGLSENTTAELRYALEVFLSGDYHGGMLLLEALFYEASKEEKGALGMVLLKRYLDFGRINKAKDIVDILKAEFPESAFSYLAQARLDIIDGRFPLAFQSIEKAFQLARYDKNTFHWLNLVAEFRGSDEQHQKIEEWFSEYRKLYPKDVSILNALFHYYQNNRKPDDALAVFSELEEVCDNKEFLVNVLGDLAQTYRSLGEYRKGIDSFNRAVELQPENPWIRTSFADYLRRGGNHQEALVQLREALDFSESPTVLSYIHSEMAAAHRGMGSREEMLKAAQEAVGLDPDNARNFWMLSTVYRYTGEIDKGIEASQEGLALKDDIGMHPSVLAAIYNGLYRLYDNKKDLEKALEYLEKAAEISSKTSWNVYPWFLQQYRHYKSDSAAIEKAKELIRKYPENYRLYDSLAGFYERTGDYNAAIEFCKKAIELSQSDIDTSEYLSRLTEIYLRKDEIDKAMEAAEKAITECPYQYRSYNSLADVYKTMGENEKALEEYRTAYELAGPGMDKTSALVGIALTYQNMDEPEKALESFQEIFKVNPNAWTADWIGRIYESRKMNDEAIAAYTQAAELAQEIDDKGRYYNQIATVKIRQGKEQEAIRVMKEYVDSIPNNPRAHFRLAGVYRETEDCTRAEEEYHRSEELSGEDTRARLRCFDRLAEMFTEDTKEYNKAIEMAEEMIALDPDYGKGYERLATVYQNLERFEDAAEAYEIIAERAGGPENWRYVRYTGRAALNYARGGWENRGLSLAKEALAKASDHYELNQNLADVYRQCRHYNDALSYYQKALELAPEAEKKSIEKAITELRKEMAVPVQGAGEETKEELEISED